MRRKNDVLTLRYARSFERLQLRTSGFKSGKDLSQGKSENCQGTLLHPNCGYLVSYNTVRLQIVDGETLCGKSDGLYKNPAYCTSSYTSMV